MQRNVCEKAVRESMKTVCGPHSIDILLGAPHRQLYAPCVYRFAAFVGARSRVHAILFKRGNENDPVNNPKPCANYGSRTSSESLFQTNKNPFKRLLKK